MSGTKEPWYYKHVMNRCKTNQSKAIATLIIKHRKNILMGFGFLFILGTFPRLTSLAYNEDVYFGANRSRRRQEGDLPAVTLTKSDSQE